MGRDQRQGGFQRLAGGGHLAHCIAPAGSGRPHIRIDRQLSIDHQGEQQGRDQRRIGPQRCAPACREHPGPAQSIGHQQRPGRQAAQQIAHLEDGRHPDIEDEQGQRRQPQPQQQQRQRIRMAAGAGQGIAQHKRQQIEAAIAPREEKDQRRQRDSGIGKGRGGWPTMRRHLPQQRGHPGGEQQQRQPAGQQPAQHPARASQQQVQGMSQRGKCPGVVGIGQGGQQRAIDDGARQGGRIAPAQIGQSRQCRQRQQQAVHAGFAAVVDKNGGRAQHHQRHQPGAVVEQAAAQRIDGGQPGHACQQRWQPHRKYRFPGQQRPDIHEHKIQGRVNICPGTCRRAAQAVPQVTGLAQYTVRRACLIAHHVQRIGFVEPQAIALEARQRRAKHEQQGQGQQKFSD